MPTPDLTSEELARDDKGRLLPGQDSLNPEGRPKGSFSLKTRVIKYLEDNPENLQEVVQSLAKDEEYRALLFQMIDGRPQQDVTTGGEKLPSPIYVHGNNSTQEDQPPQETN